MSDIALLWLLFIVGYLINCTYSIDNESIFLYCNRQCFRLRGIQWNGLDMGRNAYGHRGLDWIGSVS